MNGFFWKDMKRSFLNMGFFVGMASVAALLTAAVVTGTPPGRIRSSYYILFNVFGASGFGPFAAVFPVLAYATRFCEEYQSGYYRMIFSRMSPTRFGRIRICSVALSGGRHAGSSDCVCLYHGLYSWRSRRAARLGRGTAGWDNYSYLYRQIWGLVHCHWENRSRFFIWVCMGACGIRICSMDSKPLCCPDCTLCTI